MVGSPVFFSEGIECLGVVVLDVNETRFNLADHPLGVFFENAAVESHLWLGKRR